jgi:protein involved in sex pheromone biosynthesis
MRKTALALAAVLALLLALAACSDPCKDAADKIASCHDTFCEKYGTSSDQAKMSCQTWKTSCPNGESAVCGFDIDKCSRDNALADPILDGDCVETTGLVTTPVDSTESK